MSTELIIIAILIVYSGYLQLMLHRKNVYIESLLQKQFNSPNAISREELEEIIRKFQGFPYETLVKPTMLFEPKVQGFIFEGEKDHCLYIHYTKDREIADKIFTEGFRFAESFYKTAESITNDKLDFVYKHSLRRHFGNIVIIIAIGNVVYNKYAKEIAKLNKPVNVEQILSIASPQLNENLDEVYLLPAQYIKGYVNSETGEVYPNSNFNPNFDSPNFSTNLSNLQGK
jgi:hypothetical protein